MESWIVPVWSLRNEEVFLIGLVDCPRVEPYKQGGAPDWTYGLLLRGALKTRRCSGLDPWIIPAWSLNKRRGVPEWNHGLSLCGALKISRCSGLDLWIVPVFCSRLATRRALKTGRCSKSDPNNFFSF